MEIKLDRSNLLLWTDKQILKKLEHETGFNLYSISSAWRESDKYILKARGRDGDVIVTW